MINGFVKKIPLALISLFFFGGFFLLWYGPNSSPPLRSDLYKEWLNELQILSKACIKYENDLGFFPVNLHDLVKNESKEPDWKGPYVDTVATLTDPWGNPYELVLRENDDTSTFVFRIYTHPNENSENMEMQSLDIKFFKIRPFPDKNYPEYPSFVDK